MNADTEARLTEAQRRDLIALAERVERLTKPSLRGDLAVIVAIRPRPFRKDLTITERDALRFYRHVGGRQNFPRYTASLDAVVALIEKELPEWQFGFENWRPSNGGPRAWCAPNMTLSRNSAATPALALLAAFLRARALKED